MGLEFRVSTAVLTLAFLLSLIFAIRWCVYANDTSNDMGGIKQDSIWYGYSDANFFKGLVDYGSDLSYGWVIADVCNPTSFNFTPGNFKPKLNITKYFGSNIDNINFYVLKNTTSNISTWISNVTCVNQTVINETGSFEVSNCTDNGYYTYSLQTTKSYVPIENETFYSKNCYRIKAVATWQPSFGINSKKWDLTFNISGITYSLENIPFSSLEIDPQITLVPNTMYPTTSGALDENTHTISTQTAITDACYSQINISDNVYCLEDEGSNITDAYFIVNFSVPYNSINWMNVTAELKSTGENGTTAPTFVSAGTGSGVAGDPSPAYPTGLQANDLILLQVTVRDLTSTVTTPSGFTLLYGPDAGGTGRQWIFYKFATGSESGTITVDQSGTTCAAARMYAFRGVALTSFTEGGGFGYGSSTTINAQSVTTTDSNRLAVSFVYVNDDNNVDSFTGETGGDWVEAVAEFKTIAGSDGAIQLQTANMPSAGTISGGSYTMAASDPWGVRAFALKPKISYDDLHLALYNFTSNTFQDVSTISNDGNEKELYYYIGILNISSFKQNGLMRVMLHTAGDSADDLNLDYVSLTVNYNGDPTWWNTSFTRRANITVNNSLNSDILTNYQVPVNITYDTDMASDFSDLRFTWYNSTDDTEREIPYWIEEKVDSQWAYVWVNVTQIPASSNARTYVYYKNSTPVSSASNGTATFILFDDFNNSLKSFWVNCGNNWSVVNNMATVTSGTSSNMLFSSSSFSDVIFEFNYTIPSTTAVYGGGAYFRSDGDCTFGASDLRFYWGTNIDKWLFGNAEVNYYSENGSLSPENTWRKIKIVLNSTQNRMYVNDQLIYSYTESVGTTPGRIGFYSWSYPSGQYWDNFFARKFATIEPTYSIGAEETFDSGLPTYTRNVVDNLSCSESMLKDSSFFKTIKDSQPMLDVESKNFMPGRYMQGFFSLFHSMRKATLKFLQDQTSLGDLKIRNHVGLRGIAGSLVFHDVDNILKTITSNRKNIENVNINDASAVLSSFLRISFDADSLADRIQLEKIFGRYEYSQILFVDADKRNLVFLRDADNLFQYLDSMSRMLATTTGKMDVIIYYDSSAKEMIVVHGFSDSLLFQDSSSRFSTLSRMFSDSIILNAVSSKLSTLARTVAVDIVQFLENIYRYITTGGQQYFRDVIDSFSVWGDMFRSVSFSKNVVEFAQMSDRLDLNKNFFKTTFDATSMSDKTFLQQFISRGGFGEIAVVDASTGTISYFKVPSDAISFLESVSKSYSGVRNVLDLTVLSDISGRNIILVVGTKDVFSLAGMMSKTYSPDKNIADSLLFYDGVLQQHISARGVYITIPTSDLPTTTKSAFRTEYDFSSPYDKIYLQQFISRLGWGTILFSDTDSRTIILFKNMKDFITYLDMVGRSYTTGKSKHDFMIYWDDAKKTLLVVKDIGDVVSMYWNIAKNLVAEKKGVEFVQVGDLDLTTKVLFRTSLETTSLSSYESVQKLFARMDSNNLIFVDVEKRDVSFFKNPHDFILWLEYFAKLYKKDVYNLIIYYDYINRNTVIIKYVPDNFIVQGLHSRFGHVSRGVHGFLLFTDSKIKQSAVSRTLSDSAVFSEAKERLLSLSRSVSDKITQFFGFLSGTFLCQLGSDCPPVTKIVIIGGGGGGGFENIIISKMFNITFKPGAIYREVLKNETAVENINIYSNEDQNISLSVDEKPSFITIEPKKTLLPHTQTVLPVWIHGYVLEENKTYEYNLSVALESVIFENIAKREDIKIPITIRVVEKKSIGQQCSSDSECMSDTCLYSLRDNIHSCRYKSERKYFLARNFAEEVVGWFEKKLAWKIKFSPYEQSISNGIVVPSRYSVTIPLGAILMPAVFIPSVYILTRQKILKGRKNLNSVIAVVLALLITILALFLIP